VAFLIAILTLALLGLVVLVVGAPLRRARKRNDAGPLAHDARNRPAAGTPSASAAPAASTTRTRDDLDAAREAKYREIRDAELDFRTGKLSREDYQAIDAELRAQAIEILDEIEQVAAREQGTGGEGQGVEGDEVIARDRHERPDAGSS
jgi:hypothetical protein